MARESEQYEVTISDQADDMLKRHMRFLERGK